MTAATPTVAAGAAAPPRIRNRRGEGGRLGAEIIDAAVALLRATGSPESVTLRAVARAIGIATTSVYAHFADRDKILTALADRAFGEMADATVAAGFGLDDPVARLLAGCHAYLDYARREPHLYALVFPTGPAPAAGRGPAADEPTVSGDPDRNPGARLFGTLVDAITACARAGVSTSTDPFADAAAVWAGLHGYAGLTTAVSTFPWPPPEVTVTHLVFSLARIRAAQP